jgi:hypothetical protein
MLSGGGPQYIDVLNNKLDSVLGEYKSKLDKTSYVVDNIETLFGKMSDEYDRQLLAQYIHNYRNHIERELKKYISEEILFLK